MLEGDGERKAKLPVVLVPLKANQFPLHHSEESMG